MIKIIKLALFITVVFLLIRNYSQSTIDTENFALGEGTSSHFASVDGTPIHINKIDSGEFSSLLNGVKTNESGDIILFLGNSQTHGINQYKKGDSNYVELFHHSMTDRYVISHSIQNASMQYFLLSLAYFNSKMNINEVVVPLFYDDFREDGIRTIFFKELLNNSFQLDTNFGDVAIRLNEQLALKQKTEIVNSEKGYVSTQEKTEKYLDDKLSSIFSFWKSRSSIRGKIFIQLYQLRNKMFGINAQTIRKQNPAVFNKNMDALKVIQNYCEQNQIKLYTYIPPIRTDVAIPYDISDYNSFKKTVDSMFRNQTINCHYDLESVVPGKFWGVKNSTTGSQEMEYDFMHFTGEGHRLLYDSLHYKMIVNSN